VDDRDTSRRILSGWAGQWKLDFDSASTGDEALELLRQGRRYGAILINLRMPSGADAAFARGAASIGAEPRSPILRLVPHSRRDGTDRSLFAETLIRPCRQTLLYSTLQNLFSPSLAATRRASQAAEAAIAVHATGNEQVLLAEDNQINQKVAFNMLKRLGYTVDIATNGLEVVEAVAKKHYDVILMDMQMPEMSGIEATIKIREMAFEPERRPWIIALTANAMKAFQKDCYDAGMDDYMSKPVKLEDIRDAMDRARVKKA
jgi:CheY-like chemotaxis protein